MNEEITMKDILVAINELAADTSEIKTKVERLETRVGNIEEEMQEIKGEMKEMRAEFKTDIRRVDKKFELVLKDLYETKTDISMLEKEVY